MNNHEDRSSVLHRIYPQLWQFADLCFGQDTDEGTFEENVRNHCLRSSPWRVKAAQAELDRFIEEVESGQHTGDYLSDMGFCIYAPDFGLDDLSFLKHVRDLLFKHADLATP